MQYTLESYVMTNVGKVRHKNEDNFYFYHHINDNMENKISFFNEEVLDSPRLFGVFDGMGGEHEGEKASYIMADICRKYTLHERFLKDDLKAICHIANERVCQEMMSQKKRMGTTASMLVFSDNVYICNIGDSPIFLFRDGKLIELYEEHTERKLYQKIKVNTSKKKYHLTQNIGVFQDEVMIKPYIDQIDIKNNDVFLICSDGLTDMIDYKKIMQCLNNWSQDTIHHLMNLALDAGGKDNMTMILVKVKA